MLNLVARGRHLSDTPLPPKWGSLESTGPGRGAFEGHHMGIRCPCVFFSDFPGAHEHWDRPQLIREKKRHLSDTARPRRASLKEWRVTRQTARTLPGTRRGSSARGRVRRAAFWASRAARRSAWASAWTPTSARRAGAAAGPSATTGPSSWRSARWTRTRGSRSR